MLYFLFYRADRKTDRNTDRADDPIKEGELMKWAFDLYEMMLHKIPGINLKSNQAILKRRNKKKDEWTKNVYLWIIP